MTPRFLIVAPLLLSACLVAFGDSTSTSPPMPSDKVFDSQAVSDFAQKAAPLVDAQDDFGARLASQLQSQNTANANLLISPTSLWQALALTAGGARGETKNQLGTLLAMQKLPDDQIAAANRTFNALLGEQKGASISVANSMWFASPFEPKPDFIKNGVANFGAGVERFPATDPKQGADRINDWVSQHTQNEIPHIVDANDVRDSCALLVNAIYFHGMWASAFDKADTKPAPFHLADGKTIEVPTMNGEKPNAYLSGDSFEGVRLPYENTSCALWVLLPREEKKPTDVLSELGGGIATKLSGSGRVAVALPRFNIEWSRDLTSDLKTKAPLPFEQTADFGLMGKPPLWISKVIHACKMKVDEEGTVAAAGTVVAMSRGRAQPAKPKEIQFDRPFVVALVEETSGACLFEGVVNDPSLEK